MDKKEEKQNQALVKALRILEAMTEFDRPVKLHDISEKVSLSPSTTLRLVNTFVEQGYIKHNEQNEKFYQLTYKITQLGNKAKFHLPLTTILEKYLIMVVNEFNEAASISIESNMQMVYIASEISNKRITQTLTRVGKIGPMHATGGGKLHLLNHSAKEIEEYGKTHGFTKYTNNTYTTFEEIEKELGRIRKSGYSIDHEEFEIGLKCVSVPVYDMSNKIIAAINLSGSATSVNEEHFDKIVPFMLDISKRASEEMGYSGEIPPYIPQDK